jgi:hypothetical protein
VDESLCGGYGRRGEVLFSRIARWMSKRTESCGAPDSERTSVLDDDRAGDGAFFFFNPFVSRSSMATMTMDDVFDGERTVDDTGPARERYGGAAMIYIYISPDSAATQQRWWAGQKKKILAAT